MIQEKFWSIEKISTKTIRKAKHFSSSNCQTTTKTWFSTLIFHVEFKKYRYTISSIFLQNTKIQKIIKKKSSLEPQMFLLKLDRKFIIWIALNILGMCDL